MWQRLVLPALCFLSVVHDTSSLTQAATSSVEHQPFSINVSVTRSASELASLNKFSIKLRLDNNTIPCENNQCKITVYVTYPATTTESHTFPLIVFFNGFQTSSSYYNKISNTLAAKGYVVVQYDTVARIEAIPSCIKDLSKCALMISDEREVTFLDPILAAVKEQLEAKPIQPADFTRLGLVGHSRGGKLATLHFARNTSFQSAVLIDPVDNTQWTRNKTGYPSAVVELQKLSPSDTRTLGIIGAGVGWNRPPWFRCNPGGDNSTRFAEASRPGSWFAVLPKAGKLQSLFGGLFGFQQGELDELQSL